MINVINNNGVLTVDSRELASQLNITHTNLKKLVSRNINKFEFYGKLNKVTIAKQSNGSGGNTYYLFNEQQAVLLTGLTQRKETKLTVTKLLVDTFGKKKELPLTTYTANSEHPGCAEILDANISHDSISVQDYVRDNGFNLTSTQLNAVTRRAATMYRVSKRKSPAKLNKVYDQRYRYADNDVAYIIAAIKSVM